MRPDSLSKIITVLHAVHSAELNNLQNELYSRFDKVQEVKPNPVLERNLEAFFYKFEDEISRSISSKNLNFSPAFKLFMLMANQKQKKWAGKKELKEVIADECVYTAVLNRLQFSLAESIRFSSLSPNDEKKLKLIHKYYKQTQTGSNKLKLLIEAKINKEDKKSIDKIYQGFQNVKKTKMKYDQYNPELKKTRTSGLKESESEAGPRRPSIESKPSKYPRKTHEKFSGKNRNNSNNKKP